MDSNGGIYLCLIYDLFIGALRSSRMLLIFLSERVEPKVVLHSVFFCYICPGNPKTKLCPLVVGNPL